MARLTLVLNILALVNFMMVILYFLHIIGRWYFPIGVGFICSHLFYTFVILKILETNKNK